jgi:magnesium-transporting ATPase (P-type)
LQYFEQIVFKTWRKIGNLHWSSTRLVTATAAAIVIATATRTAAGKNPENPKYFELPDNLPSLG